MNSATLRTKILVTADFDRGGIVNIHSVKAWPLPPDAASPAVIDQAPPCQSKMTKVEAKTELLVTHHPSHRIGLKPC